MIYLNENENGVFNIHDKSLFLFDMDGTLYIDDAPIEGSVEFIKMLSDLGKKKFFFTNNSSKTRAEYVRKLRSLGINAAPEEIITSNMITARYLKENHPGAKIMYMGNFEATKEISEYGLNVIPPYYRYLGKRVDILVMAYDTGINYEKIKVFSYFLRQGAKYIATHPDINCPSSIGLIPDVGAFMAMFEASTGRIPDIIMGKPSVNVLDLVLKMSHSSKDEAVFIGDRMYTDIRMACEYGISSILVLSGESVLDDLPKYQYSPDLVVDSLDDLYRAWGGKCDDGK